MYHSCISRQAITLSECRRAMNVIGFLIVVDHFSYIRTDVTGKCLCLGCHHVNVCCTLMWCWSNFLFRRRAQLPPWPKYLLGGYTALWHTQGEPSLTHEPMYIVFMAYSGRTKSGTWANVQSIRGILRKNQVWHMNQCTEYPWHTEWEPSLAHEPMYRVFMAYSGRTKSGTWTNVQSIYGILRKNQVWHMNLCTEYSWHTQEEPSLAHESVQSTHGILRENQVRHMNLCTEYLWHTQGEPSLAHEPIYRVFMAYSGRTKSGTQTCTEYSHRSVVFMACSGRAKSETWTCTECSWHTQGGPHLEHGPVQSAHGMLREGKAWNMDLYSAYGMLREGKIGNTDLYTVQSAHGMLREGQGWHMNLCTEYSWHTQGEPSLAHKPVQSIHTGLWYSWHAQGGPNLEHGPVQSVHCMLCEGQA